MKSKVDKRLLEIARNVVFSFGAKTNQEILEAEMKKLISADRQYTDAEIIQALNKARETY